MKEKHAYLIIAHHEFEILKILLSMLDDDRNDIYLHIDKKVKDIDLTGFQTKKSKLIILDKRIDGRWGNLSLLKIELLLFETAYNSGKYLYFHLLSGVDLPIKSQDYIHDFFDRNMGKEFVGYGLVGIFRERISKYIIFTFYSKCDNKLILNLTKVIRCVFLCIQKMFNYHRKEEIIFMKGAQWVSVTSDLVSLLLEKKEFILKRFRFTFCSDEFFIQSILWNSALRDRIYNLNDEFIGCMRAIDWNRGLPYTWTNEDFEELKKSDKLFARKFSSDNMMIVRKIQNEYSYFE